MNIENKWILNKREYHWLARHLPPNSAQDISFSSIFPFFQYSYMIWHIRLKHFWGKMKKYEPCSIFVQINCSFQFWVQPDPLLSFNCQCRRVFRVRFENLLYIFRVHFNYYNHNVDVCRVELSTRFRTKVATKSA